MAEPAVTLTWSGKEPRDVPRSGSLSTLSPAYCGSYLVHGDNLQVLAALQSRWGERVRLAYLDPPFLTGKQHLKVTRQRDAQGNIQRRKSPAFDDRWANLGTYLGAMKARIELVRELLAPDGCMVLHVDPKTSHYLKVLCDEVFGPGCFASEIIWRYRRWPAKTVNFQRVHDVLLRYVKDPSVTPCFTTLYEPLAPSTLATWGDRKQRAVVGNDGRRARSSSTREKTPGAPMGDVWDIGIVAPVARERTGYPTQKPEALLERVIQSCSGAGDWVLDPYAGSGTTLAVGARLGRRVIGMDNSPEALRVTQQRLVDQGNPVQFRALANADDARDGPGVRKAS
jgi:site-specific DNA-methyltransferase (adenine-specific)